MRRISAFLVMIFALSLLSAPFGATGLVTVTSPANLLNEIENAGDMAVIDLAEGMTFGEDCPSLYIGKSITLRSSTGKPVTLREGRFIIEGRGDDPITVVFENIDFLSDGHSDIPAIYATGNLKITFSGCTFKGYAEGGVRIFAQKDHNVTATFKNCLFEGNSFLFEGGFGGGLYAEGAGRNLTINMSGCVFNQNLSSEGGGLAFSGATVTLTGCTFTDNDSNGDGGGLYGKMGSLTLNNCLFSDNHARIRGGGLALWDAKLTALDSVVAGNSAKTSGGGLWLEEVEHPYYAGVDGTLASGYPYNRDVNIDNCSFYLNSTDDRPDDHQEVKIELLGDIEVNIRLSTFAYGGGLSHLYDDPYIDFFGCILEEDGVATRMPSAENGYCLIYDQDEYQPTVDSEGRLSNRPHLNCVNDDPALRIPLEAVKAAYGNAFSGYYGTFPVGDNYGEVSLVFPFFPLRTERVKMTRGTPISEIPAPMRDMYSFGGWFFPDGSKLAGYRLLVGGDVSEIEFSPLWTHNSKYYLTLAGVGLAVACGTVGWIVIKRRMKKTTPHI